jgi:hypothetical protein
MYMVMLVLDVPDRLDAVLDAWDAAGVHGATIAETFGIHRRRAYQGRVAARYAVGGIEPGGERGNYTLWAIVPDAEAAQRCLAAAEGVIGDLDGPDTGVLAAWPLTLLKGASLRASDGSQEG